MPPPGETKDEPNWRTIAVVGIVGLVVVLILWLLFSAIGPDAGSQATPTPGATSAPQANIEILEPVNGAVLDIAGPVTVSGLGGGLPEGNVVVQALDLNNNVLAQVPTTVDAPDAGIGGEGPWTVQLTIQAEPGTPGRIIAFADSPADGSRMASDSVEVSFGATPPVEIFIEIEQPADGSVVDIASPVTVSGTGGGLFEGNVIVQATGSDNRVLVETATTVQSPDAGTGGQGPWSVTLDISTQPGSTGQIIAYSTSPEDGSTMASDTINVTYGTVEALDPTTPPDSPLVPLDAAYWVLVSSGGAPVLAGSQITADFGEDGQVTGLAGCNSYFAPFEVSGASLTIGLAGSTRMACSEPQGVMEQETAYLSQLTLAATYEITGGQLVLRDPSGADILVYNAAVTGLVNSLQEVTLPADAILTVQLQDVSLQDAPAVILGEQVIQASGQQLPILFMVVYDPTVIQQNRSYSMMARITDAAGNLLFISDTNIPVITGGSPTHDVEILVVSTGS
jgi:uncharacterized lipoprotein YbaY/heat shock protein HslJ